MVGKLEGRVSKFHFSEKRRYDPISDRFNTRTTVFPTPPKSRTDFWLKKLESNMIRDQLVNTDLERLGWRVISVWECELREPDHLAGRLIEIRNSELQGGKP